MRRRLSVLGLSVCLLFAGGPTAWAQEEKDPSELARESVELMMRSLNLLIESIPQYELPEINEDGDIIIRRKRNTGKPESDEDSDLEKTRI